jgi:hypothetical protein
MRDLSLSANDAAGVATAGDRRRVTLTAGSSGGNKMSSMRDLLSQSGNNKKLYTAERRIERTLSRGDSNLNLMQVTVLFS